MILLEIAFVINPDFENTWNLSNKCFLCVFKVDSVIPNSSAISLSGLSEAKSVTISNSRGVYLLPSMLMFLDSHLRHWQLFEQMKLSASFKFPLASKSGSWSAAP